MHMLQYGIMEIFSHPQGWIYSFTTIYISTPLSPHRTNLSQQGLVEIRRRRRRRRRRRKMSLVTEKIKASASEIYYGDEICQEKSKFLLEEVGLPRGLLPLKDIIECGYVKETGFVWLKQKKSITHKFESVGRVSTFATEVTAFVEKNKIKKLTGVKTKELLVWLTLSEIYVDPSTDKITFKIPSGLFRSFPASAFEIEGEVKKEKKEDKEDQIEVKKEENEVKNEKKEDKEDQSEVKMEKKEDKDHVIKEAAAAAVEVVKVV